MLVAPEFVARVEGVRAHSPMLRHVLVIGDEYEAAMAAQSPARDFPSRSGEDLYILYTGGTTGLPKGVVWKHQDVLMALGSLACALARMGTESGVPMPLLGTRPEAGTAQRLAQSGRRFGPPSAWQNPKADQHTVRSARDRSERCTIRSGVLVRGWFWRDRGRGWLCPERRGAAWNDVHRARLRQPRSGRIGEDEMMAWECCRRIRSEPRAGQGASPACPSTACAKSALCA